MPGILEDIERIRVNAEGQTPASGQPRAERDFAVRDQIVERIRRIAGDDSIKRIEPLQNQGDYQEQDIDFDMGDDSFRATVRYDNALTEGWVTALRKYPKIC